MQKNQPDMSWSLRNTTLYEEVKSQEPNMPLSEFWPEAPFLCFVCAVKIWPELPEMLPDRQTFNPFTWNHRRLRWEKRYFGPEVEILPLVRMCNEKVLETHDITFIYGKNLPVYNQV